MVGPANVTGSVYVLGAHRSLAAAVVQAAAVMSRAGTRSQSSLLRLGLMRRCSLQDGGNVPMRNRPELEPPRERVPL